MSVLLLHNGFVMAIICVCLWKADCFLCAPCWSWSIGIRNVGCFCKREWRYSMSNYGILALDCLNMNAIFFKTKGLFLKVENATTPAL